MVVAQCLNLSQEKLTDVEVYSTCIYYLECFYLYSPFHPNDFIFGISSHDLIMDDCLVRSISSVNGAPTINQTSSTSDLPFIDDNLEPHSTGLFNCLCSFARRCCVV